MPTLADFLAGILIAWSETRLAYIHRYQSNHLMGS